MAVILGIVEGLTEFLPVSSTAHLRIVENWMSVSLEDPYWKMFSIVIQLGAILCLPIYFRKRIAEFLSTFPTGKNGNRTLFNHPVSLTLVAFFCTAIPSFLLTKIIGKHLESLVVMGTSLLVGGVIMWLVDVLYARGALPRRTETMDQMSLGQAVWIGFMQVLSAVFPGTSRSMATIAAGQLGGMSRSAALEFSFFLSIPTMVAATGYDLLKSLRPHDGVGHSIGTGPSTAAEWVTLAIGFVVSFIVAYGVVAWFMRWVRTRGFVPFAFWRIVIGIVVLATAARMG
ncbi:MAG TPA: undecaprenyl-diphosphate phosphatase [Terriglobales bacterium]|nr:undecaprenyl-diphosphate phosphatase [Terriglobales bacterium]